MGGAGEAGGMSEAKVSAGTSDRPRNHIRRESPPRKRRKAELKTRIAEHLSGRGRPSWRSHVTEYANILWQHRYVSTESEKCPVERPMTGQNAHFEQLIR